MHNRTQFGQLTLTGKSNTLTKPKSSPVANSFLSLVKSEVFTSVTSECGGQIPSQLSPNTPVQENHSMFAEFLLVIACLVPRGASKNNLSFAPEFVWRSFPVNRRRCSFDVIQSLHVTEGIKDPPNPCCCCCCCYCCCCCCRCRFCCCCCYCCCCCCCCCFCCCCRCCFCCCCCFCCFCCFCCCFCVLLLLLLLLLLLFLFLFLFLLLLLLVFAGGLYYYIFFNF